MRFRSLVASGDLSFGMLASDGTAHRVYCLAVSPSEAATLIVVRILMVRSVSGRELLRGRKCC